MNDELRDIQPLFQIGDFLPLLTIPVGVLFLLAVAYLLYRRFRNRKSVKARKALLAAFREIPFDDPKKAAYQLTELGRQLVRSDDEKEALERLVTAAEKYKYKKLPPEYGGELERLKTLFLETLHG